MASRWSGAWSQPSQTTQGEAEGTGLVQPRKKTASGGPNSSLSIPMRRLSTRQSGSSPWGTVKERKLKCWFKVQTGYKEKDLL